MSILTAEAFPHDLAVSLVTLIESAPSCSCRSPSQHTGTQNHCFFHWFTDTLLLSLSWELRGECLCVFVGHHISLGRDTAGKGGKVMILARVCNYRQASFCHNLVQTISICCLQISSFNAELHRALSVWRRFCGFATFYCWRTFDFIDSNFLGMRGGLESS